MQTTINDVNSCRKSIDITIEVEQVNKEYNRYLDLYSKNVRIPGFRVGKAPLNIVKLRCNKDVLGETKESLLSQSFHDAIKENELNLVSVIDVRDVEFDYDKPMSFSVDFDVVPEFKLPKYKGISITANDTSVSDDIVEKFTLNCREHYATYEDVDENHDVKPSDMVMVDFEGTCDGQPIEDISDETKGLGKAADFFVIADDNSFLPGFGEALHGLKVGDKKDFDLKLDDKAPVAALKEKTVHYNVEVKKIRTRTIPEIDDEFLGKFGFESKEAMYNDIRKNLKEQNVQEEKNRQQQELIKNLLKQRSFDIPEKELRDETINIVRDIAAEYNQRGVGVDDIDEQQEKIIESAKVSASERVKLKYILHSIATNEDIKVEDNEVEDRIAYLAQAYRVDIETLKERLNKNLMMDNVRQEVLQTKTLNFLLENAKIK